MEFPNCAEPMPDLYNLLDFLQEKSVKMAIVTNGSLHMQNTKINKYTLKSLLCDKNVLNAK